MSDSLEELFLHRKPVRLIVKLSHHDIDRYASALSSEIDATYSHTVKILQRMEAYDLVEFEKKGRRKEVTLTEKGEDVSAQFRELLKEFGSMNDVG